MQLGVLFVAGEIAAARCDRLLVRIEESLERKGVSGTSRWW